MDMHARVTWIIGLLLLLTGASAVADPGTVLSLRGQRPERVIMCESEATPPDPLPPTTMQRRLAGVVADLSGREFTALFAAFPLNPPVTSVPEDAVRRWVLHLERRERTKRVEILRASDGGWYARELDAELDSPRVAELDRERFSALCADWPRYVGGFEPPEVEREGAFELEPPLTASHILLDSPTLRVRMARRSRGTIAPMSRDLDESHMYVRLPRGYDPRRPAGVLVWVSPMPDGVPPRVFDEALDRFNLIAIGAADSGNARPSPDRYQLALDAVATCMERYHVDASRVYVTGLSGGGRVASMLWGCFPDVFTGAVPIVGLNSYKDAPAGGARHWPADYEKPTPAFMRLLREQRLAAMTGPPDFNYENTISKANGMERDGLAVRVFEYEDMGHTLPTSERFVEALGWVDEPARRRLEEAAARAERLLASCVERRGEGPPDNPGHQRELEEVMEAGPWSEAAWRAWELLHADGGTTNP